jgi:hypothetical protein
MPEQHPLSTDELDVCWRFSEALAAGDADAALAHAHPEIEIHRVCDVLSGASGVRRLAAGPQRTGHTAAVRVDELLPHGAGAVARGRVELRREDTGALAESRRVTAALEVRDGLVVRWQANPPVDPS